MPKQRTQQPEPQHHSAVTQQDAKGPVTGGGGGSQAAQVGDGASQGQEEGKSKAEPALDRFIDKGKEAVGDIWDTVEDWGLEQLDSVQAILTYVDTVGVDVAMPLLMQVGADLMTDLVAHLATMADPRELLWTMLDWLKSVAAFVGDLTPEQLARLVKEAIGHKAEWLLDEVAALAPEVLLAMVQLMDGPTLEELVTVGDELGRTIIDTVWPPGVGVDLSVGGSRAIAFFAVGAHYAGTFRHLGGGRLEGTFEVSGSAGLETGVGEKVKAGSEEKEATATLHCGAGGVVSVSLATADLGTWDASTLVGAVAGGLGLAQTLDTMLGADAIHLAEMITAVGVGGDVSSGARGERAGGDLAGATAALGQKIGAGAVRCSNMRREGGRFTSGTVELEFSSGAYAKVAGTKVEMEPSAESGDAKLALALPPLESEISGESGVRVRADVDLEALSVDHVELEAFVKGNAAGIDAEAALQGEFMDAHTLNDFLDRFEALTVSLAVELHDAAAKTILQDNPLHALAEPDGMHVQGTLHLSATLDRDSTRFIAETVAGRSNDDSTALERLKAWAMDPLGPELADAQTLLCMELAQAAQLEARLQSKIELIGEAGFEIAEGLKLGLERMLGACATYEADLLTQGVAPTTPDFDALLRRLGTEAQAEALATT